MVSGGITNITSPSTDRVQLVLAEIFMKGVLGMSKKIEELVKKISKNVSMDPHKVHTKFQVSSISIS